jgi:hypothetical protein
MATEADRDYHTQRARAELDWSYRAVRRDVAEAHMRLSALHMERARSLAAAPGGEAALAAPTLVPQGH